MHRPSLPLVSVSHHLRTNSATLNYLSVFPTIKNIAPGLIGFPFSITHYFESSKSLSLFSKLTESMYTPTLKYEPYPGPSSSSAFQRNRYRNRFAGGTTFDQPVKQLTIDIGSYLKDLQNLQPRLDQELVEKMPIVLNRLQGVLNDLRYCINPLSQIGLNSPRCRDIILAMDFALRDSKSFPRTSLTDMKVLLN